MQSRVRRRDRHHGVDVPLEDGRGRRIRSHHSNARSSTSSAPSRARPRSPWLTQVRIIARRAKRINDCCASSSGRLRVGSRSDRGPRHRQARFIVGFADGACRRAPRERSTAIPRRSRIRGADGSGAFTGRTAKLGDRLGARRCRRLGRSRRHDEVSGSRHAGGRPTSDVVLAEKSREDWVRGRSQWKFVRWGASNWQR